jgi:hypothetical protein
MKLRLSIILLAAAALAAAPAAGQTIKSLGYNTTNGNIVAATNVTFTNSVGFATNARAATRTNLGGTAVGNSVFTATNAAAAATAISLGAANDVTFNRVGVGGATLTTDAFSGGNFEITSDHAITFASGGNPATTRTNLGLGANDNVTFSNITASGTLTATGNATLNGVNNTMPNATNAASASSLMTRGLTDQREIDRMIAGPRMVWLTTFNGWQTSVSGGSVAQNQYLAANSGTNQWDYAVARNFQSMELFSGAGDTLNFSKGGSYGVAYYSSGANNRNGTDVIYLGERYDYAPSTGSGISNITRQGFGWRIKDESIVATMFNTNYVEVATNSTVLSSGASTRQNVWLYINWNGTGGASWYVNGTNIASTTNGPTGATTQNHGWFIFGSVADIPLTTQNNNSITAIVLDREP